MIIYYEQIDSTNRVAKELVAEGKPAGTIVYAGMQSAGKGQYGRAFNSPLGGLYFSLTLQPNLNMEHLPLVTLATGLACHDVIQSKWGLQPQIKWPNDIYLDDKKVAGILCENVISNSAGTQCATVVIGVGLNVNNTLEDFPIELRSIVTTLYEHLKEQLDLGSLRSLLVDAIVKNIAILHEDTHLILSQWQQYDFLYEKSVAYTVGSLTIQGIGLGISSQGYYRIRDNHGVEHRVIGGQLRPRI